jgi:hypothetical protein
MIEMYGFLALIFCESLVTVAQGRMYDDSSCFHLPFSLCVGSSSGPISIYTTRAQEESLIAHWNFDDHLAVDSSGNNVHGEQL